MQIVIRCDCASFGQRGLKTCKSPKTKLCHIFKVKEAPHKRLQGAKSTVNKHLILREALQKTVSFRNTNCKLYLYSK